ncbi:4381_t:CDS:2 [Diversispora eburnea]|uniref:4381_t:CDS:1 n=1 Tax=Diversispora eburnea TaxID=1213867 RepID=A0A9N8V951_9GLOM|nr:4381_t:CDS:2 [Diversispora eburnea]
MRLPSNLHPDSAGIVLVKEYRIQTSLLIMYLTSGNIMTTDAVATALPEI